VWEKLVDTSIILRAVLMTDASDVNLAAMEAAIVQRRNFEQGYSHIGLWY
jgi:hypothetical protein